MYQRLFPCGFDRMVFVNVAIGARSSPMPELMVDNP